MLGKRVHCFQRALGMRAPLGMCARADTLIGTSILSLTFVHSPAARP